MFYYQTFDRANLQFTNVPLYTIHQPQPPAPAPGEPVEGNTSEGVANTQDGEPPAADGTPETAPGTYLH